MRVMAFDAQDNLIAGSDGSGLIYRIACAGEGIGLYRAPKKEITALALDRAGKLYAAAVGEKRSGGGTGSSGVGAALLTMGSNPPAGGTAPQAPGLAISPAPSTPPAAGPFPFPGGGASGRSDVSRIASDGSPPRVLTSAEDVV